MSEDSAAVPSAFFALGTTAVTVAFVTVEQGAGRVPNRSGARVGLAEPPVPDPVASVEPPELEPVQPASSIAGATAQASSPARRGAERRRSMGRGVLCWLLGWLHGASVGAPAGLLRGFRGASTGSRGASGGGPAHWSYELGIHLKGSRQCHRPPSGPPHPAHARPCPSVSLGPSPRSGSPTARPHPARRLAGRCLPAPCSRWGRSGRR